MCPVSKPLFERMRAVKMLFKTALDAASHLNKISHNVMGWWSSTEVQAVRDSWVQDYALVSEDWSKDWKAVLG